MSLRGTHGVFSNSFLIDPFPIFTPFISLLHFLRLLLLLILCTFSHSFSLYLHSFLFPFFVIFLAPFMFTLYFLVYIHFYSFVYLCIYSFLFVCLFLFAFCVYIISVSILSFHIFLHFFIPTQVISWLFLHTPSLSVHYLPSIFSLF